MAFDLGDYVDVATRIAEFREKHPEGSFQTLEWQVLDTKAGSFVVYRAAAYRTPDDPRPGHGSAWEPLPGKTPYTKDSEFQNAETSAWGRALIAVLAADTRKGIASADEVRNRQSAQEGPAATPEQIRLLGQRLQAHGSVPDAYRQAHHPTPQLLRDMLAGVAPPMSAADCEAALALVPAPVPQEPSPRGVAESGPQDPAPVSGGGSTPETPPEALTGPETGSSGAPAADRYAGFQKDDLKAACALRGLAVSGTVDDLRARLEESDHAALMIGPRPAWYECQVPGDPCHLAATCESGGLYLCCQHEPL